ncbi:MAG TPA: anthranilate phosphoribosyltransferase [Terriglobia bacterium]|nr:anthranilate phosphoribosyltransferase [Terriglobia bacterium]
MSKQATGETLVDLTHKVIRREHLNETEARAAMDVIMTGAATDAQIAAFLVGLRMKGETAAELVGFTRSLRDKAERFWEGQPLASTLDTCGTGGDGATTFNISTATAFVAAGGGARVAKHGNRSTRGCGSAGVLEALGVNIQMPMDRLRHSVTEIGFGFLFAPRFHGAMKHAMPIRNQLRMPTVFNILGPLANPALPDFQVVGVYSEILVDLIAEALLGLGVRHAYVVHGVDGVDEVSISAQTRIVELRDGAITRRVVAPEDFGIARVPASAITGGDAAANAATIENVLKGQRGPHREIVLLNAAIALTAAGVTETFKEGFHRAIDSINSGRALETLHAVRKVSA